MNTIFRFHSAQGLIDQATWRGTLGVDYAAVTEGMEIEPMGHSARLICFFAFTSLPAFSAESPVAHIVGHYSDKQLEEVRTLILPRIFLYDSKDQLVPDEQWPPELAEVKKHKGDGRCCLTYYKTPGGGPPPECANPLFGNEGANWSGLTDNKGTKIDLQTAPLHKWLIVEYAATWCAPCVVQEKQLNKVLASIKNASDYAWITIDMTKVTDVKDALKKANKT
jgi:hypothetical protein